MRAEKPENETLCVGVLNRSLYCEKRCYVEAWAGITVGD